MSRWRVFSTILSFIFIYFCIDRDASTSSADALAPCTERDCNINLKCNPHSRVLFGKFLLWCWSQARLEIGLSNPFNQTLSSSPERLSYKNAVGAVVLKVFNYNAGALIFYKNWQPVPYIRSQNRMEQSVVSFLSTACKQLEAVAPSKSQKSKKETAACQRAKSQSHLELLVAAMSPSSGGRSNETTSFTIVADPLSRFANGYQDSINRLYWRSDGEVNVQVKSSEVRKHLNQLFNYEKPVPITYENLYPITGAFFDFHIGLIARQEDLQEDWKNVICPHFSSIGLCSSSVGVWERMDDGVMSDQHGAVAALQELFASEPRYLRALCHLLLVDYVCLPMYVLPSPCQFLNATRRAAEDALDQGKELPYNF